MFSFFSRNKNLHKNALAFIGKDMHNHILPGIDDGSPDLDTSRKLTEGLAELGFTAMVSTPHTITDLYPNTKETISGAFKLFESSGARELLPGGIAFASEYMVNYDFENQLVFNELLTFGQHRYILVEMSYLVESPNIRKMIFALVTNGFQPILAHPERYQFYHHRRDVYEEMVDAGCMLQLNLLSLAGYYGGEVRSVAKKLIEKDLISWVGTDMHHPKHLEALQAMATDKNIIRTLEKIKNLRNPDLKIG